MPSVGRFAVMAIVTLLVSWRADLHAATITYTYDTQHRLVQASYSDSQREFYNYDAAGNVEQHVVITDAKYLQSWLLYFSLLDAVYPGQMLSPCESALRALLAEKS